MNRFATVPALLCVVFLGSTDAGLYDCTRYASPAFGGRPLKTADVVYATAPALATPLVSEASTVMRELAMDIFLPRDDQHDKRPAIVFFHGGAFVSGSRDNEDMVALCDSFAARGYVTATVSYRLGAVVNDPNSPARAVYRAIQDGRSAIRFLRANAATYGIDSTRIYAVGSSAGAIIGLHSVYMNLPAEKPAAAGAYTILVGTPPFQTTVNVPDLGGFDAGQFLERNGTPDAVVPLWGALQDTLLVQGNEHRPLLLVHGAADSIVKFNTGSPFGISQLPVMYGSRPIRGRLLSLAIASVDSYFVEGAPHEFYGVLNGDFDDDGVAGPNEHYDIIIARITSFLRNLHKPSAEFTYAAAGLQVSFRATDNAATDWLWDFGDGDTAMSREPAHTYAAAGTYTVRLIAVNDIESWDTLSAAITVEPATSSGPAAAVRTQKTVRVRSLDAYDIRGRRVAAASSLQPAGGMLVAAPQGRAGAARLVVRR